MSDAEQTGRGADDKDRAAEFRTYAANHRPTVAIAKYQSSRGVVTVPVALRRAFLVPDDGKLVVTSNEDGSVTMRPAPAPETWFARYDALVAADHGEPAADDLPKRWVNTATLIRAQVYAEGPQRRWFEECDRGFVSARVDPVMLAEWLERLSAILPSLDRRGIASYVQVVLSWTGMSLMERDVYLAALELWGSADGLTWPEAVRRCRDEETG
ncbi:hypothetical protein [Sulfobacillus harzensis]|uniref:Uncharacterized protein n=1 Tax=Sulfobacillus harzensis TaxID=2729629 RepID=A0A7Y0L9S5_9FIRM|nr:hypothetical protein [Sulfobacillus harzensis]NMP25080.1 hypothetical protein [Sulfobacillus harzensis]